MDNTPASGFLECMTCHALIDFSKSQKPDSRVLCPKCGRDFGTQRDVNEKYQLAIKLSKIGGAAPGGSSQH